MQSLRISEWFDNSIDYSSYAELITIMNTNGKLRRLMDKGYAVKDVKIVYGADVSRGTDPELKPMYAVVSFIKEGYSMIYIFVDIVKKRIIKVVDIKKR